METSFDEFKKKYYSNTLAATSDVDEYHSYSVSGIEKNDKFNGFVYVDCDIRFSGDQMFVNKHKT